MERLTNNIQAYKIAKDILFRLNLHKVYPQKINLIAFSSGSAESEILVSNKLREEGYEICNFWLIDPIYNDCQTIFHPDISPLTSFSQFNDEFEPTDIKFVVFGINYQIVTYAEDYEKLKKKVEKERESIIKFSNLTKNSRLPILGYTKSEVHIFSHRSIATQEFSNPHIKKYWE